MGLCFWGGRRWPAAARTARLDQVDSGSSPVHNLSSTVALVQPRNGRPPSGLCLAASLKYLQVRSIPTLYSGIYLHFSFPYQWLMAPFHHGIAPQPIQQRAVRKLVCHHAE